MNDHKNIALKSVLSQDSAVGRKTNYYSGLHKGDIITELMQRKVKFISDNTKAELVKHLDAEMHGVQRVPALYFTRPLAAPEDMNLELYECLGCEPLHCIGNHIKNLFEEIPYHLEKEEKRIFSETVEAAFQGKEAKRGCDYRLSLIYCCVTLKTKIPKIYIDIFETLHFVQHILYRSESERTPTNIFRLYNLTFKHSLLLNKAFKEVKHLTKRKLFGQYYHAIVKHAPDQYRIISGMSSNTESEERQFNFFKQITKSTSNHHPNHVILNAIKRLQVKEKVYEDSSISQQESKISKLSAKVAEQHNFYFFSFSYIEKNPWEYQSYLERIADFLLEGNAWEEQSGGIKFNTTFKSKKVHHFRSFSIKSELQYVTECWEKCLKEANTLIPAEKIKLSSGEKISLQTLIKYQNTSTLGDESPLPSSLKKPQEKFITTTPTPKKFITTTPIIPKETILSEIEYTNETPTTSKRNILASTPLQCLNENNKKECNKIIHTKTKDPVTIIKPCIHKSLLGSVRKTKTATLLEKLFGKNDDISAFNKARLKLKAGENSYESQYQTLVAKFEVKVLNLEDELKTEQGNIENEEMVNSNGTNTIPTDKTNKQKYENIAKKLCLIQALKNELQI